MKKLFLFVAVATLGLTTSCSSDDNSGGGASGNSELKVTIDGTPKTFNTIDVYVYDQEDGYGFRTITASIDNNPSEIFVFTVEKGDTGAGTIYNFSYTKNGTEYGFNTSSSFFTGVVQTNNNSKIKGTFIGKVGSSYFDTNNNLVEENIELTNGSFDISY